MSTAEAPLDSRTRQLGNICASSLSDWSQTHRCRRSLERNWYLKKENHFCSNFYLFWTQGLLLRCHLLHDKCLEPGNRESLLLTCSQMFDIFSPGSRWEYPPVPRIWWLKWEGAQWWISGDYQRKYSQFGVRSWPSWTISIYSRWQERSGPNHWAVSL